VSAGEVEHCQCAKGISIRTLRRCDHLRMEFTSRLATFEDVPRLTAVMDDAIAELQRAFLDDEQIEASRAVMGIDTQLIEDGTYFVVETPTATSPAAAAGAAARRCTATTTAPAATPSCLIPPSTRRGCARCTRAPRTRAAASVGSCSRCARRPRPRRASLAARARRDAVRRTALRRVRLHTARADRGLYGSRGARRPDGEARQPKSAWLTPFRGVHAALPAT
jgi:hypothetical protein